MSAVAVTTAQAELCASFMLDQDPSEVVAPMYVLDALDDYQYVVEHGNDMRVTRAKSDYLEFVRAAIEKWLAADPRACVGLLGPGLGIEQ